MRRLKSRGGCGDSQGASHHLDIEPCRSLGFGVGDVVALDGRWVRVRRVEVARDLLDGPSGGRIRSCVIDVSPPRMLPPGGFM